MTTWRLEWLSIVKTKPRCCVQVVQDSNNEITLRDDVLQLDELVDMYWVALSINIKENSNSCIVENTFVDVDVDVEELDDVLRTSGHTKVDEDDDNDETNVEDCDEDDNNEDEIKEKEDKSY